MSAIAQLNDNLKAFEKQKKDLIKNVKKDLKSVLKELFSTIPEIKSIYWTQYSPYFNDGDSCTFSLNTILISNTDKAFVDYEGEELDDYLEEDEDSDKFWVIDYYSIDKQYIPNKEHLKLLKDFVNALYKSEELLEEIFGNHVKVIGTKSGFRVEDYSDHD